MLDHRGHLGGPDPSRLTAQEAAVARLVADGLSNRQVAAELFVSIKTIQVYCARIKEKLGHGDGIELVRAAVRWVDRRDRAL